MIFKWQYLHASLKKDGSNKSSQENKRHNDSLVIDVDDATPSSGTRAVRPSEMTNSKQDAKCEVSTLALQILKELIAIKEVSS